MALPLGHTILGLGVIRITTPCSVEKDKVFITMAWAIALSNLPDIDFVAYMTSQDVMVRHGATHSVLFALACSIALMPFVPWLPRWRGALTTFLILLSHSIVDFLYVNTPVAFFWPLQLRLNIEVFPEVDIPGNFGFFLMKDFWVHFLLEGLLYGFFFAIVLILINNREGMDSV